MRHRSTMLYSLENAPEDDEPETPEEASAVAEAWREHLESLNRAYEDSPSAEEREQMQGMRQKQWELMKGEW